jgi:predicted NAD-dependent protein-ADP-ribosyltransferase YbiA (DUF1768 family)
MIVKQENGHIILQAETTEEQAQLKTLLEEQNELIFQLRKTEKGPSFFYLGPKETACNLSINVLFSREDKQIQLISNLGHAPFEMDGIEYASVEAFWQSLKFEPEKREPLYSLFGKEAKKAGAREKYTKYVSYKEQKVRVGSSEHWALMQRACEHKFEQHTAAREALLATGIRPLYHKPRKDSVTIPGPIMAGIWMNIRSKLRREAGLESDHLR